MLVVNLITVGFNKYIFFKKSIISDDEIRR